MQRGNSCFLQGISKGEKIQCLLGYLVYKRWIPAVINLEGCLEMSADAASQMICSILHVIIRGKNYRSQSAGRLRRTNGEMPLAQNHPYRCNQA